MKPACLLLLLGMLLVARGSTSGRPPAAGEALQVILSTDSPVAAANAQLAAFKQAAADICGSEAPIISVRPQHENKPQGAEVVAACGVSALPTCITQARNVRAMPWAQTLGVQHVQCNTVPAALVRPVVVKPVTGARPASPPRLAASLPIAAAALPGAPPSAPSAFLQVTVFSDTRSSQASLPTWQAAIAQVCGGVPLADVRITNVSPDGSGSRVTGLCSVPDATLATAINKCTAQARSMRTATLAKQLAVKRAECVGMAQGG